MATQQEIKSAMGRVGNIFKNRPSMARLTEKVICEVTDGLRCDIRMDGHSFASDNPVTMGGEDTAPSPGTYARGALGSCLAIGYAMMFASRDIPYTAIRVRVEADFDARGSLGIDGVDPSYEKMRYFVDIESSADAKTIQDALNTADANSPILGSFRNPVPVERSLQISSQVKADKTNEIQAAP